MTDQKHPITPPPELIEELTKKAMAPNGLINIQELATTAVRWGADQELEACCEVVAGERSFDGEYLAGELRAHRRPKKPLSLKEQALAALVASHGDDHRLHSTVITADEYAIIRRALEQLKDD